MITMKELEAPVRQWVPDWLGLISIFVVILPVTMLNGSYTGSMLEVSNTLGTNSEDITMGYYAASAGMAIAYPIIPKVLAAFSVKSLLLIDLILQFFLSWVCARTQNADILIVCSFAVGFLKGFLMLWFIRYAQKIFSRNNSFNSRPVSPSSSRGAIGTFAKIKAFPIGMTAHIIANTFQLSIPAA